MWILGLSAYYHDSAAVLIKDGVVVAAAQEERFNRKKHSADFPKQAIEYCLREAGITLEQVDNIIFYEKPFLKFERLLETYHAYAPSGFRSFVTAMRPVVHEAHRKRKAAIGILFVPTCVTSLGTGSRSGIRVRTRYRRPGSTRSTVACVQSTARYIFLLTASPALD